MRIELLDPQGQIFQEIADRRMKREDVALTYAFLLRQPEGVDFAAVNRAIIERWSLSALKWVKGRAWKLAGGRA